MHRFCQANLSAFLDGELAAREREVVAQHLQQCQECRWNLQTLEHTVNLLHEMPPVKAPRSFRIPHSVPAPAMPFWMRPWAEGGLRVATAAATVLLVVALAGNALALPAATSQLMRYGIAQEAAPSAAKAADGADAQALAATAPSSGQESGPARETWPPSARGTLTGPITVLTPPFTPRDNSAEQTPAATPLSPEDATRAAAVPPGMGGGATEPTTPTPGPAPTELPPGAAGMGAPTATEAPKIALTSPTTGEVGALGATAAQPGAPRELQPVQNVPQQPPFWQQMRQRLTGYPWREMAIAAGGLLAVLLAATLWLRMVRVRWP